MSIERVFDKLDEKASSLIRSIGIIITLLFGFLALIFNYLHFTLIMAFIFLILAILFLINIIYTMYIYVFASSKTHDYVNMISSNYRVLKSIQNFYIEIIHDLEMSISYYYSLVLNKNREENFIIELKNEINKNLRIKQNNNIKYQLRLSNVGEINYYLERFKVIFKVVSTKIPFSNDKSTENEGKDFNLRINNLIEAINRFFNDIVNYFDLVLMVKSIAYGGIISDNIFSLFRFLIEEFRDIIDGTYRHNILLKNVEKDRYEIKIKISYSIFGLCLIISCFLLLLIIMSIPLTL